MGGALGMAKAVRVGWLPGAAGRQALRTRQDRIRHGHACVNDHKGCTRRHDLRADRVVGPGGIETSYTRCADPYLPARIVLVLKSAAAQRL